MSMNVTIVAGQNLYGTLMPHMSVTINGLAHEGATTRLLIDEANPSGLSVFLLNGKEVRKDRYDDSLSSVDLKALVEALREDLAGEQKDYIPYQAAADVIKAYLKAWKKAGSEHLTAIAYCA